MGTYKTTYKNGNVETFIYKNGIKEGPAKYVYNNGDIEEYIYAKEEKKVLLNINIKTEI